jgi:hypothetical protein
LFSGDFCQSVDLLRGRPAGGGGVHRNRGYGGISPHHGIRKKGGTHETIEEIWDNDFLGSHHCLSMRKSH